MRLLRARRALLDAKGVDYEEINVGLAPECAPRCSAAAVGSTVPQIFVGERHMGGFDDLVALEAARANLIPLLNNHGA